VSTFSTFISQLVTSASRSLKHSGLAGWKGSGAAAPFMGGCIENAVSMASAKDKELT